MWQLFRDSPARKETYIRVCSSEIFPLRFCPTRWAENVNATERAISVWSNITKTMKECLSLAPNKRPNNKSYESLLTHYKHSAITIKFHLFKGIALLLQGSLKTFQTDRLMVPFLSDAVGKIIRQLMKMFLRREIVVEAVTPYQLINIDCAKEENQLIPEKVTFRW